MRGEQRDRRRADRRELGPPLVRWRLQAYREAAVRLLEGQSPRRVAPVYLHQTLGMPQEDARAVGERVSVELALRTWLAL